MAEPQPREHLVCLVERKDGSPCWKPAKWFISSRVEKKFLCGVHAKRYFAENKHEITDQVLIDMANFYPDPDD